MLLKTKQELLYVVAVSQAIDFSRVSPSLAQAELSFIMPLLGSDMYAALIAYHNDPDSYKITSDLQDNNFITTSGDEESNHTPREKAWGLLLYYTQRAIANIAFYIGFDSLNAFVDASGFHRMEGNEIKSMFKYQEDGLKKYFRNTGADGLDIMLEILETRIEHFDAFKSQLIRLRGRIIPDTKTFSQHYFINNSRIVFERLRQHMKLAEDLHLTPVLGKDNLNYIIAELQKETPDPKVTAIMPYLRDPVAYYSTAMLMQETGAELTDRGLYLKGIKNLNNSDLEINTPEERVTDLIARNLKIADQYLNVLRNYLAVNAAQWNDYANPRSGLHNRDNSGKRTFFV
ncbi:MAG: DUF6712 family protein [Bacteroidales bacterium]